MVLIEIKGAVEVKLQRPALAAFQLQKGNQAI